MSKFNQAVKPQTVTNLAGGEAYAQTPEVALASMLATSFVSDKYYQTVGEQWTALRDLLGKVEPEFAAKAAVYTRHTLGMRSISHVVAAEVAKLVSGKPFARSFYEKVIRRPDDITEILAYYRKVLGQKALPNAMKRGLSAAFAKFDGYQLGKYRGEGKAFKLIDAVNLLHPKATDKNRNALNALVAGTLRQTNTWEDKMTAVGKGENVAEGKSDVWATMLTEKTLGYLALVRNLRNIIRDAPDAIPMAVADLTNEEKIHKSLVSPLNLVTAYGEMDLNTSEGRTVADALEKAIEIAYANVPAFDDTLVVVDNSGSMTASVSGGKLRMSQIAAAFGMILAKRSNADIMEFGSTSRMIPYRLTDSVMAFAANFHTLNQVGHGTDFRTIFGRLTKPYKRIVIFSDMQGWVGYRAPTEAFKAYKSRTGANPFVYSVDLAGYGTTQLPASRIFTLAGFSPEMFTMMERVECDPQSMISAINEVAW